MQFSLQTLHLLESIERLAKRRLAYRDELALLIELSSNHNQSPTLDQLSFFAKFAHKTSGIMQRIGSDADGYEKLSKEMGDSIEKSKSLLCLLLDQADTATATRMSEQFLALTPMALQNLLALFHDLSWYKNFQIDSSQQPPTDPNVPPPADMESDN